MPPIKQRQITETSQQQSFAPQTVRQPDVYSDAIKNLGNIAINIDKARTHNNDVLFNKNTEAIIKEANFNAQNANTAQEAKAIYDKVPEAIRQAGISTKGESGFSEWENTVGKPFYKAFEVDKMKTYLNIDRTNANKEVVAIENSTANDAVWGASGYDVNFKIMKDTIAFNVENKTMKADEGEVRIQNWLRKTARGLVARDLITLEPDTVISNLKNTKKYVGLTPEERTSNISVAERTKTKLKEKPDVNIETYIDLNRTSEQISLANKENKDVPIDVATNHLNNANNLYSVGTINEKEYSREFNLVSKPILETMKKDAKSYYRFFDGGTIGQTLASKFVSADKELETKVGYKNTTEAIFGYSELREALVEKGIDLDKEANESDIKMIDDATANYYALKNTNRKKSKAQMEYEQNRALDIAFNATNSIVSSMTIEDFKNSKVGTIAIVKGKKRKKTSDTEWQVVE